MQYKKIISRILFGVCLVSGSMDIYNGNPANALLAMAGLYFCIPLVSLSLTPSSKSYLKIFGIIGTIALLGAFGIGLMNNNSTENLNPPGISFHLLGMAIFIGGSIYSVLHHQDLLQHRKTVTLWSLGYVHSSIFCMVCAIAGTLSIYTAGKEFSVTCDQVRGIVNQHMSTILTPLRFTTDQIDFIQSRVDKFFTKSTDDLIQDGLTNKLSNSLGGNLGGSLGGGLSSQIMSQLPKQLSSNLGSAEDVQKLLNEQLSSLEKNSSLQTQPAKNPLAEKMKAKQQSKLLSAPLTSIEDKQELDNKICHVVFDQIKEWSNKPGFKRSIIASLFFFIYPISKLFAFIFSILLTVVYWILKKIDFISAIPEEHIVEKWLIGDNYQSNTILSALALEARAKLQAQGKSSSLAGGGYAGKITVPTSPTPPVRKKDKGLDIGNILGNINIIEEKKVSESASTGGTPVVQDVVVANSTHDTTSTQEPSAPKDNSPHVDFGSIGGNFGKKPSREDS